MTMHKETRLKLAIALAFTFMIVEVLGGYFANSIAIFSDAAHLLTDIAGFAIALVAAIASNAPGTKHLTFGLARAEVFGALLSVLSLWLITAVLLYAAFLRALAWYEGHPEPINGKLMFFISVFGVLVNICLGYVFQEEHGSSLHPGHSHDHDHGSEGAHHCPSQKTYSATASTATKADMEKGGHDHDHGHGHGDEHAHSDHDHGHDHGHGLGHDHHDHGSAGGCCSSSSSKKGSSHDHDHASNAFDHSHDSAATEHSPLLSSTTTTTSSSKKATTPSDSHDGHSHNHGHHGDVNIEAAYMHVLADLIQSIGVAFAGVIIWFFPGWEIIDPLCTFIFSIIALGSTVHLLKRVGMILFEGTPSHIDWELVHAEFEKIDGVEDLHDLHIWNISSTSVSLTCHMRAKHPQNALKEAHIICRRLGINHPTIQVQDSKDASVCYAEACSDALSPNNCVVSSKYTKTEEQV